MSDDSCVESFISGIPVDALYRSNNCTSWSSLKSVSISLKLSCVPISPVAVLGPFIPTCFETVMAYVYNKRRKQSISCQWYPIQGANKV